MTSNADSDVIVLYSGYLSETLFNYTGFFPFNR